MYAVELLRCTVEDNLCLTGARRVVYLTESKMEVGVQEVLKDRQGLEQQEPAFNEPRFLKLAAEAWMVALRLGLPQMLARSSADAGTIATALECDERAVRMLLDALETSRNLDKSGDMYDLSREIKEHLALPGIEVSEYFDDELEHVQRLDYAWSKLCDVVKQGKPVSQIEQTQEGDDFYPHLARNLFPGNYLLSRHLIRELYPQILSSRMRIIDIGAGSAAWSIPFAEEDSSTSVTVVDFESVTAVAQHFSAACGVLDQYDFLSGNLHDIDFGDGVYDLAILGHLCHSEGAENTRRIFRKVHRALRKGGAMLIVEFIRGGEGFRDGMARIFALNMLVNTSLGGTYSKAEYDEWACEAGFGLSREILFPGPSSALIFDKTSGAE